MVALVLFSLAGILYFLRHMLVVWSRMSLGRVQPSIRFWVFGGILEPGRYPVFTAFQILLAFCGLGLPLSYGVLFVYPHIKFWFIHTFNFTRGC